MMAGDACQGTAWIAAPYARYSNTRISLYVLPFLFVLAVIVVQVLVALWWTRRRTYRSLVRYGFPTVFWRPKFVHYDAELEEKERANSVASGHSVPMKKLASSTITNIIPRMQRLNGPYGMYGTVYGVSTAVVHVAHPVPAMALLGAVSTHLKQEASPQRSSWFSSLARRPNSMIAKDSTSTGATKAPAYNHFKNFCGEGVFTADGDDWRSKRAAVLHALLRGKVPFQERVQVEANRSADRLNHFIDRNMQAEDGETPAYKTNVVPVLQRTTIGLIYRYITHADLSTLTDDDNDTTTEDGTAETETSDTESQSTVSSAEEQQQPKWHQQEQFLASYLQSITRIRMIILAQSRSIWFLLPRWCYRAFASLYKAEERTMDPIRQMAARACFDAKPNSPLATLQELPLYESNNKGKKKSFSSNLVSEAITLLFAGQDTSAATLSWTLHLLTLYPHVQAKLAKEVCDVLNGSMSGDSSGGVHVTKKLISKMVYLDAVIKESMRLYPVAPFVVRKVESDLKVGSLEGKFTDGEQDLGANAPAVSLPAGSLACIWIYSLHRHPQFWSRPDDFVPERWLVNSSANNGSAQRDKGITTPGAFIPFAAGPRNCVGQPLANVILRTLLARLIYRYEFRDECVVKLQQENMGSDETAQTIASKIRKDMQAGFTVLPKGGLMLSIQSRRTE